MNPFAIICYVGLLTCSLFVISQATVTVGGQYAVNVHFVPPLVNAPCSIAQLWTPQNVTCAMCFCITGTLSRCVPQPGCSPNAPNNTTTTTTTSTPNPQTNPPENPTQMPASPDTSEASSTAEMVPSNSEMSPTPPAAEETASEASLEKRKRSKSGKSKRRLNIR